MHTPGAWRTQHVATHVYRFAYVASTQTEARHLIARGAAHGALVIAQTQAEGRGRLGRRWHSPADNLYLSFVLAPARDIEWWPSLTHVAALALADSLRAQFSLDAQLKWPNDVLIAERKVAGLLAEVEGAHLILGVGVNVNAAIDESLPHATSLRQALGHSVDREPLLQSLIETFDGYYAEWLRGESFAARWAERMHTLGRAVRVQMLNDLVEGVAEQVDETGALHVRRATGERVICRAGEVTLARGADV